MIKNNIKLLLIASLAIVSCNNDDTATPVELPVSAGTANFTKFVSLGNSLTAGFSDGALFIKGQQGSYTNIMAQQFKLVGGGDFKIPLMNDNVGGLLPLTLGQFPRLTFNGVGPVSLAQAPYNQLPTTPLLPALTGGPYNNMGVPGAKSFHLLSPSYGSAAGLGAGTANPYYVRFASSPTTSILAGAIAQAPTFFSLWIGNNDVLSYATSGGTGANQTGNPNIATYGGNDITDPTAFASVYDNLVNGLTAGGAKGVVANIPYVSSIPFFTTVPANPVTTVSVANATQLNTLLIGSLDGILTSLGQPDRFIPIYPNDNNPATTKDANPLLIIDETLTDFSAQITAGLILGGVSTPQANLMGSMYGRARHAVGVLRLNGTQVIGTASNDDDYVNPTALKRDYILLTSGGLIGTTQPGFPVGLNTRGVSYPLQDAAVLTADETNQIKVAVDAYNVSISSIAAAKGLALVDANGILNQVANGGIRFGNYHLSSSFATGGAFSLDGVHPSPRGYALIANKFLEAINAKYGSTFKMTDLGNYPVQYPASL